MEIVVLTADEGMVLTDGQVFGKIIHLGSNRSASEFWQITQAEYDVIMNAEEEMATEEDYRAALSEFGVKL